MEVELIKYQAKSEPQEKTSLSLTTIFFTCLFLYIFAVFMYFVTLTKSLPVENRTINVRITANTVIPHDDGRVIGNRYSAQKFAGNRFSGSAKKAEINEVSENAQATLLVPDDAYKSNVIPANYTLMEFNSSEVPVYVFMNNEGVMQYRVLAKRSVDGKNEIGLMRASIGVDAGKIVFHYDLDGDFVRYEDEQFGQITLQDADGDAAFGLTKVYGHTGLYYLINERGQYEYYGYGHYEGCENGYFVAGNDGKVIDGTLPLEIN